MAAVEDAVEDLKECLQLAREQLAERGAVPDRLWEIIDRRLEAVISLLPSR